MTSVRPECRLRAMDEGTAYPRSACLKCGWRVTKSKIETTCIDPQYSRPTIKVAEDVQDKVSEAMDNIHKAEESLAYKSELERWVESIVKHTGLQMSNPQHVPLIMMYTLMAMHKGKETTQEDIHDAWALWTLFIRKLPNHENMLPFDSLSERVKVLDKADMWAIHRTAGACYDGRIG